MQERRESDIHTGADTRYGSTDIDNPYGAATDGDAGDAARGVGDRARETADRGVDMAAERVGGAASRIRDIAGERGGVAADAGTRVADGMERTASYLREHDTQEMVSGFRSFVKEHPMQAVAGALVGGYLIAKVMR